MLVDKEITRLAWSLPNSPVQRCDRHQKLSFSYDDAGCVSVAGRLISFALRGRWSSGPCQRGFSNLLTSSHGRFLSSRANVLLCSSAGSTRLNCCCTWLGTQTPSELLPAELSGIYTVLKSYTNTRHCSFYTQDRPVRPYVSLGDFLDD